MRLLVIVVAVGAAVAQADIATWWWEIHDTGNDNAVLEPGEAAELTLWMGFEPAATGFAMTGPYAITGNADWAAGVIESHETLFDPLNLFGDGAFDNTTNTISGIQHLQFPPIAGHEFWPHNPLAFYSIRWRPATYEPAVVTLDNGAPDVLIYIDDWGATVLYTGAGGMGEIVIVPAPATAFLILAPLGLTAWGRRRRR